MSFNLNMRNHEHPYHKDLIKKHIIYAKFDLPCTYQNNYVSMKYQQQIFKQKGSFILFIY